MSDQPLQPARSGRGWELYHGDAEHVLPRLMLPPREHVACVTDPPWPRGEHFLPGFDPVLDTRRVLAAAWERCARLIVIVGAQSDPRWIAAVVPGDAKFYAAIRLDNHPMPYGTPGGGCVSSPGALAYMFGSWPGARPPVRVWGTYSADRPRSRRLGLAHPCPRLIGHMRPLVKVAVDVGSEVVVDPFAGSGTTLAACVEFGVRSVGIEIDERWLDDPAKQIDSRPTLFDLHEPAEPRQEALWE